MGALAEAVRREPGRRLHDLDRGVPAGAEAEPPLRLCVERLRMGPDVAGGVPGPDRHRSSPRVRRGPEGAQQGPRNRAPPDGRVAEAGAVLRAPGRLSAEPGPGALHDLARADEDFSEAIRLSPAAERTTAERGGVRLRVGRLRE